MNIIDIMNMCISIHNINYIKKNNIIKYKSNYIILYYII